MTEPITVRIPQEPKEWKLVLVPASSIKPNKKTEALSLRTTLARYATPHDLRLGGYMPLQTMAEVLNLRRNLRDAEQKVRDLLVRAEKAEATLAMYDRPTYVEAIARAEKAEAERDALLGDDIPILAAMADRTRQKCDALECDLCQK